jgi:hypothetical protein
VVTHNIQAEQVDGSGELIHSIDTVARWKECKSHSRIMHNPLCFRLSVATNHLLNASVVDESIQHSAGINRYHLVPTQQHTGYTLGVCNDSLTHSATLCIDDTIKGWHAYIKHRKQRWVRANFGRNLVRLIVKVRRKYLLNWLATAPCQRVQQPLVLFVPRHVRPQYRASTLLHSSGPSRVAQSNVQSNRSDGLSFESSLGFNAL